jgi:hypothetical protein
MHIAILISCYFFRCYVARTPEISGFGGTQNDIGSLSGFYQFGLGPLSFKVFWHFILRHGHKIFKDKCYCLSTAEFILLIKYSLSTGFLMKCSWSISGNTLATSWATSSAEQNIILILGLNAFILWNS